MRTYRRKWRDRRRDDPIIDVVEIPKPKRMGFFRLGGRLFLFFVSAALIWNFTSTRVNNYQRTQREKMVEKFLRDRLKAEDFADFILLRNGAVNYDMGTLSQNF